MADSLRIKTSNERFTYFVILLVKMRSANWDMAFSHCFEFDRNTELETVNILFLLTPPRYNAYK